MENVLCGNYLGVVNIPVVKNLCMSHGPDVQVAFASTLMFVGQLRIGYLV